MSDIAADIINDLRERADKLGEAVANLEVFRCLLAELDARTASIQPPLALSNQQVRAVYAVRAALLRSAIALIAAILDTAGRDRASLGRVVQIMGHGAAFVANVGPHNSVLKSEKLRYVCDRYPEIYRRDDYQRLLQLRHDELGHCLSVTRQHRRASARSCTRYRMR